MAKLKAAVMVVVAVTLVLMVVGDAGASEVWNKEEQKQQLMHVNGKVLCQDCSKGWNDWIHGKPIKGARVSITCMDDKRRIVYYGSDESDEEGEFNMAVAIYLHGKKKLTAEGCLVRLVSSPKTDCNIPTDFAGGRSGVKLGAPSHVNRDFVKHTLEPFYYTTRMCDDPIDDQTT